MNAVRRVHDKNGSHIEPPLDQDAQPLDKLLWHAAVCNVDSGVDVEIREWHAPGLYIIQDATSSTGPFDFYGAWTYINGISAGAQAVQR